ncbi:MAG: hypothetical protein V4736_13135 [Bdellovibrionota bacterium]
MANGFLGMVLSLVFTQSNAFALAEPWTILPNGCIQTDVEIACDPFTVNAAEDIAITGKVSYDFVLKRVQHLGYLPVRLATGGAIGAIEVINYQQSALGPYREVIVYFAAHRIAGGVEPVFLNTYDFINRSMWFNMDPMNPEIVYFIERLILDSSEDMEIPVQKAINLGRRVYGLPKERGMIATNFNNANTKSFRVTSPDSMFSIDWKIKANIMVNWTVRVPRDVYLLSEKNGAPILSRSAGTVYATTPTYIPFWDSSYSMPFGPGYDDLNFVPEFWVYQVNPNWKFAPLARFLW